MLYRRYITRLYVDDDSVTLIPSSARKAFFRTPQTHAGALAMNFRL